MIRKLLFILILAAVLRGLLLFATAPYSVPAGSMTGDSADYLQLAETYAQGRSFARDGRAEIFRTPGYPLFLAAGNLPGAARCCRAPLIAQVLIDTALVGLTGWLALLLLDRRAAVLAALFQAVTPLAVAASCRVLSDSLYTFFFTLAILLMVRHFTTGGRRPLLAAAAVLGVACYIRPVGQIMAVPFLVVILVRPKRLHRAAAFAGVLLACLAPWVVRNATVADYYGFSSFAGDSAWKFSASRVLAAGEGGSVEQAQKKLLEEESRYLLEKEDASPGDLARWRTRRARDIILSRPWTYAKIHLRGCAAFFLPGATDVLEVAGATQGRRGTLAVLQREGLSAAVRHYFGGWGQALALAGPMLLIFLLKALGVLTHLIGTIRRRSLRFSAAAWLAGLVVVVSALLGGPMSTPRFRLPVEPLLSITTAAGLVATLDALIRKKKREHEFHG
jgi:4-amino-4-deoxy-L-arabinose transferase-like glycosyltransferase